MASEIHYRSIYGDLELQRFWVYIEMHPGVIDACFGVECSIVATKDEGSRVRDKKIHAKRFPRNNVANERLQRVRHGTHKGAKVRHVVQNLVLSEIELRSFGALGASVLVPDLRRCLVVPPALRFSPSAVSVDDKGGRGHKDPDRRLNRPEFAGGSNPREIGAMARAKQYSAEVRERAVRLVGEHAHEYESEWAAIQSVAQKIGCSAETLRGWIRQRQRDEGKRPGLTSQERERL